MTREQYESLSLQALKDIGKSRGMKRISSLKKKDLIDVMLQEDSKEEQKPAKVSEIENEIKESSVKKSNESEKNNALTKDHSNLDSGNTVEGFLEILSEGYGFIRSDGFFSGDADVYVSPAQIKRFGLRTGDIIKGNTKVKEGKEKFSALLYVTSINGKKPESYINRKRFEKLTPIFPNERIRLETKNHNVAMNVVDIISPIGKGQRGMIVAPPKAGKTTLLKNIALSIKENNPEMYIIILLIDERPEEVTDIKETIVGDKVEVVSSTFDELPERHRKVSEMIVEKAKRLAESGEDVIILLDSITRLTRAYNITISGSGRTLSGGLDPAALHMPKRFFGAARNLRESGSLTILATALIETGSKMDDVVYEEFKGTGNMELILDRKLQEKRVFPAIDIAKSGTRRDDLLLSKEEIEALNKIHRGVNGSHCTEVVEKLLDCFSKTKSNKEFIAYVNKMNF